MNKHTPGPWQLQGQLITADGLSEASRLLIAEVHLAYRKVEEFHGNAHLIAAAPELLEVAQYALGLVNASERDINEAVLDAEKKELALKEIQEVRAKIVEAIAKAEGK